MKQLQLPSDAVLILVARAAEDGARVDISLSEEWWAGASKDHRKALFVGALEALGRIGSQVIPDEFAGQQLDPPLMRFQLDEVLADQVAALLLIAKNGGDIRVAVLDHKPFLERLQETLDARQGRQT